MGLGVEGGESAWEGNMGHFPLDHRTFVAWLGPCLRLAIDFRFRLISSLDSFWSTRLERQCGRRVYYT